ncbi:MAG: hypothetical protein JSS82_07865 [Bacteroidetes bacterium]|nr:hypothetical protein [Bacteroidota bacterium]
MSEATGKYLWLDVLDDDTCNTSGCFRNYGLLASDFNAVMNYVSDIVGEKPSKLIGFVLRFIGNGKTDDDIALIRFNTTRACWTVLLESENPSKSGCDYLEMDFPQRAWSMWTDRHQAGLVKTAGSSQRGTVDYLIETKDTASTSVLFRETMTPKASNKGVVFDADSIAIDFSDHLSTTSDVSLRSRLRCDSDKDWISYSVLIQKMDLDMIERATKAVYMMTRISRMLVNCGKRAVDVAVSDSLDCTVDMKYERVFPMISESTTISGYINAPLFTSVNDTRLLTSCGINKDENATPIEYLLNLHRRMGSDCYLFEDLREQSAVTPDTIIISPVDPPIYKQDVMGFTLFMRALFNSRIMGLGSRMTCRVEPSKEDVPDDYRPPGDLSGHVVRYLVGDQFHYAILQSYRGQYVFFQSPIIWHIFNMNLHQKPETYTSIPYGFKLHDRISRLITNLKVDTRNEHPFSYHLRRCFSFDRSEVDSMMDCQSYFRALALSSTNETLKSIADCSSFVLKESDLNELALLVNPKTSTTNKIYNSLGKRKGDSPTASPVGESAAAASKRQAVEKPKSSAKTSTASKKAASSSTEKTPASESKRRRKNEVTLITPDMVRRNVVASPGRPLDQIALRNDARHSASASPKDTASSSSTCSMGKASDQHITTDFTMNSGSVLTPMSGMEDMSTMQYSAPLMGYSNVPEGDIYGHDLMDTSALTNLLSSSTCSSYTDPLNMSMQHAALSASGEVPVLQYTPPPIPVTPTITAPQQMMNNTVHGLQVMTDSQMIMPGTYDNVLANFNCVPPMFWNNAAVPVDLRQVLRSLQDSIGTLHQRLNDIEFHVQNALGQQG